ncbi:UDP-glucuronosyltransferase [Aphelenchoides besseyi]|nr:UDP-glucuronosyltransferase [Aphelenchoides besseyi]KAI6193814.1 UDP-glucuronosyltransferase [Aphelenchoides besseyi]
MNLLLFSLLSCTICASEAAKILFYSPRFGRSHLMFVGKLADTLAEANNDVTIYQQLINDLYANMTGSKSQKTKIIERQRDFPAPEFGMDTTWTEDSGGITKSISLLDEMGKMFKISCEHQLRDNKTLELLKNEKFDIAISEFFDMCAFGIFRRIGIKKTIVLYASAMPLDDATFIGLPSSPSFVPDFIIQNALSGGFWSRFGNTMSFLVGRYLMMPKFTGQTAEAFKIFDEHLDYRELIAEASLYFVNTDELVDFPRPISHKIINIGGVGMSKAVANVEKLDAKYKKIFDEAKDGVVYMSFGSVAKSYEMPDKLKKAFLDAFKEFPNVNFIWKYEKPEHKIADGVPNVYDFDWVPQNHILAHPSMKAFMTHGGANSLSESSYAGVPMIGIPLFGDQNRNAINIEERGLGLRLTKDKLTKEAIVDALRQVVYNDKFKKNAQKLAKMIRSKPLTPDERLIKYTEFVAQHDVGDQLSLAGRQLNFFQYYSLDVFGFIVLVVLLAISVIFFALRFAVRRIGKLVSKAKTE